MIIRDHKWGEVKMDKAETDIVCLNGCTCPWCTYHLKPECAAKKAVWHKVGVFVNPYDSTPKTQKVLGLRAIDAVTHRARGLYGAHVSTWRFIRADDLLEAEEPAVPITFPFFLRPCPIRPRHGFVESRRVHNMAEVLAVAREALDADPDAELLATPFIAGDHSAILTPGSLSYGKGHDGATSGESAVIYGPAFNGSALSFIKEKAAIMEDDIPYVELVEDNKGMMNVVQVRGGPALDAVQDYIPKGVTVRNVLVATPNTDLVKWEKDIAEAETGTVVYAPGLSLASHFCVHAVVHQVPVLTTREPKVGETLVASGAPEWTEADWKRLAGFVKEADIYSAGRGLYKMAELAPIALHIAGQPAPATDPQLRVLAYGAVAAAKALGSASLGEARHLRRTEEKWGKSSRLTQRMRAASALFNRRYSDYPAGRSDYYEMGGHASLSAMSRALIAVSYVYNYRAWARSFGGRKWALINSGARMLSEALIRFSKRPSAETWATVVKRWNVAIHREHNGDDTALGKFGVSKPFMDACALWPVAQLAGVHRLCLEAIFNGPDIASLARGALNTIEPASGGSRHENAINSLARVLGLDIDENVTPYKEAA